MAVTGRDRRVRTLELRAGGPAREREDRVVVEAPLEVGVQGTSGPRRVVGITLRTPGDDLDLAVGWLASQGLLAGPEALRGARWCTDADLGLTPGPLGSTVAHVLAGGTVASPGGSKGAAEVDAGERPRGPGPVASGGVEASRAQASRASTSVVAGRDGSMDDRRKRVDARRPADPVNVELAWGSADPSGDAVTVDVAGSTPALRQAPRTAHAGCGLCGDDLLDDLVDRGVVPAEAGRTWHAAEVLALPALLRGRQPTFARTGGLHAALRVRDGDVVAAAEDVGRHNAVDKLVGHGLRTGDVDWSRDALVLSGRVGYELVAKAAAAGCPLVVGVGATTSLAIDLADRFGVTLACFAGADRANVHTHGARIVSDA